MPIISLPDRIPRPIRRFKITENDASFTVFRRVVAPHVEIAPRRTGGCSSGALEPGVLIGGMIDDQFSNNLQVARVSLTQQIAKVPQGPINGIDLIVVGDVVAIIP